MVKIDNIKLEQFDTEKYEVPDFYTNLAQISVTKSDCTIIFKKPPQAGRQRERM